MTAVVVTVPKGFWLDWIDEGDAVGQPPSGEEWAFFLGGQPPQIRVGELVYVVAHGRLRGYAPLTSLQWPSVHQFALCRRGGAVAVTLPEAIPGFRGWRYRWWDRKVEQPFDVRWKFEGVQMPTKAGQRKIDEMARQYRSLQGFLEA